MLFILIWYNFSDKPSPRIELSLQILKKGHFMGGR